MSLCQSCLEHLKTRNIYNKQERTVLYLVNIPQNILMQMSYDQLQKVKSMAEQGIMLCRDCLQICRIHHECPQFLSKQFVDTYIFRGREDQRVIQAIQSELQRRRDIALTQLEALPSVANLPLSRW